MHNKPTLGNAANFLFYILFIVVILVFHMREHWLRLANNLQWLQFSILADSNQPPVVETALPELSEVDLDLLHNIILFNNVPVLNLVPRQQTLVESLDRRWCSES